MRIELPDELLETVAGGWNSLDHEADAIKDMENSVK